MEVDRYCNECLGYYSYNFFQELSIMRTSFLCIFNYCSIKNEEIYLKIYN